jgi:hypothetical protein
VRSPATSNIRINSQGACAIAGGAARAYDMAKIADNFIQIGLSGI